MDERPEDIYGDLAGVVAQELVRGRSREQVIHELVKQGMDRTAAYDFVTDILIQVEAYKRSPEGRAVVGGKYRHQMVRGLLWVLGGTVVTVGTYLADIGGGFLIAWGAIIFGGIDALIGLVRWLSVR